MLIVLGLVSVVSYFVYVYLQDKDALTAQINSTNVQLANEQSNRLSNIKYVVDQVNTVNSDISTQFSSSNSAIFKSLSDENTEITANLNKHNTEFSGLNKSITGLQSNVSTNTNNISSMTAGFGNYITFGNPQGTNAYNLLNLPSSPPANMNLMTHVNMLMGMTAQNLSPVGGSNINFCYGPDNKNCTSFPNEKGDTVISAAPKDTAGFKEGRDNNIVLNGSTKINGITQINGPLLLCDTNGSSCSYIGKGFGGDLWIESDIAGNGKTIINSHKLQFTDSNVVDWNSPITDEPKYNEIPNIYPSVSKKQ